MIKKKEKSPAHNLIRQLSFCDQFKANKHCVEPLYSTCSSSNELQIHLTVSTCSHKVYNLTN